MNIICLFKGDDGDDDGAYDACDVYFSAYDAHLFFLVYLHFYDDNVYDASF